MPSKVKGSKRFRVGKPQRTEALSSIDESFSTTQTPLKTDSTGRWKFFSPVGRSMNTNGDSAVSSVSSSSYPMAALKVNKTGSKTITLSGVGYGSGTVFWQTDAQNWWASIIDLNNTATYESYSYISSYYTFCNAYGTVCTQGYGWYNYVRHQYRFYCQAYGEGCTSYGSNPNYTSGNYRFRTASFIRIIRSIANSVSTVATGTWDSFNGTENSVNSLNGVTVVFDSAGTAITAYGTYDGVAKVSTSASGGNSSRLVGVIAAPATASGSIQIGRLQIS